MPETPEPPQIYLADTPAEEADGPLPGIPEETEAELPRPETPPVVAAEVSAAAELATRRLEEAVARQEELRSRQAEMPQQTIGEELDGAIRVTVDAHGLMSDVRFRPAIADVDLDELGPLVLSALREAQQGLQRAAPGPDALTRLHDSTVADALLSTLDPPQSDDRTPRSEGT